MKNLLLLFLLLTCNAAAEAQISERLTGRRNTEITGIPFYWWPRTGLYPDSASYYYSGNRGSRYDYDFMSYDDRGHSFLKVPYTIFPERGVYYPYGLITSAFNADSNKYWANGTNGWYVPFTEKRNYNANNQLTYNNYDFDWSPFLMQSYYYYNPSGKLSEMIVTEPSSGPMFDTVNKITLHYDSQNRLIADTTLMKDQGIWSIYGVRDNTYDPSGNIVAVNIWQQYNGTLSRVKFFEQSYNPDNLVRSFAEYTLYNDSLKKVEVDSFEYDGTNSFFRTMTGYLYDTVTTSEVRRYKLHKTLNNRLLPDSCYTYDYDYLSNSWTVIQINTYGYTLLNNPEFDSLFIGNSGFVNAVTRYYYQPYNATAINEAKPTTVNMRLYPNPAKNSILIHWKDADGKRKNIDCFNAVGQRTFSQSVMWQNQEQTISLAGLSPGIYWVIVSDTNGDMMYQEQFFKE